MFAFIYKIGSCSVSALWLLNSYESYGTGMSDSSGCGKEISCTDYYISIKIESGRRTNIGAATLIYAGNEPKSVLARD